MGYNIQAAVDSKNKIIVGFDTGDVNSLSRFTGNTKALTPISLEAKENLGVDGFNVLVDKGYHTGDQLALCAGENIVTYVSAKEPASNDD